MINNDAVKQIDELFKTAGRIVLLTHANADGDALGSSLALMSILKRIYGKNVTLVLQEQVPQKYRFLSGWDTAHVWPDADGIFDLAVCVDTGDTGLLGERAVLLKDKCVISMDHHSQRKPFADIEIYKPDYSSAGEVVFEFLETMNIVPNAEEATCIYTAIVSDTGGFQHDNTGANTHRTVRRLMENAKINTSDIGNRLFNSSTRERNKLISEVLGSLKYIGPNGSICIGTITVELLRKTFTHDEDTEGIINYLLNTEGVEIAALIKERSGNACKVSFRSRNADVSAIASSFGGGGHVKAAGCTIAANVEQTEKMLTERLLKTEL